MERMLEGMVIFIARIHNYILSLNDAYEKNFTDKQLHFLVIGIIGMLILVIIYPLFKILSENHILAIAFIYVFTVIVVITLLLRSDRSFPVPEQWISQILYLDLQDFY